LSQFNFECEDIASVNFDTTYCSETEIEEISMNFEIEKSQIYENCKSELESCKNDISNKENIIESDEKENLIEKQNLQTILQ